MIVGVFFGEEGNGKSLKIEAPLVRMGFALAKLNL
jgi:hypothetical protein